MEIKEINFTVDDDPTSKLLELLCGQVFHVTEISSFHKIIKSGAIQNNKHGQPFGLKHDGTGETSYSVANGYVAFFDLRGKHHEHDRKWIDKWLLEKYHIVTMSHFKVNETDKRELFSMAFLLLNPEYYQFIKSYEEAKNDDPEILKKFHLIPYVECWVKNKVPVEWIQTIYKVHVETKPFATKIFEGKTDEQLHDIDRKLSELTNMAKKEDY